MKGGFKPAWQRSTPEGRVAPWLRRLRRLRPPPQKLKLKNIKRVEWLAPPLLYFIKINIRLAEPQHSLALYLYFKKFSLK